MLVVNGQDERDGDLDIYSPRRISSLQSRPPALAAGQQPDVIVCRPWLHDFRAISLSCRSAEHESPIDQDLWQNAASMILPSRANAFGIVGLALMQDVHEEDRKYRRTAKASRQLHDRLHPAKLASRHRQNLDGRVIATVACLALTLAFVQSYNSKAAEKAVVFTVRAPEQCAREWAAQALVEPSIKVPGSTSIQCYAPATGQFLGLVNPSTPDGLIALFHGPQRRSLNGKPLLSRSGESC
ncbi:hypothetical protein MRB53_041466 [Persea americana]|nr:hypothetical protein MRB53_041466 [Persea americana]